MRPSLSTVPPIGTGPALWREWHAAHAARVVLARSEHALYTDARLVGELRDFGPFDLINTVPVSRPRPGDARLALVLRFERRLPFESVLDAEQPRTRVGAYYGGWVDDEVAALVSLSLSIRCRSGGLVRYWDEPDDRFGRPAEFDHRRPYLAPPKDERASVLPDIASEKVLEHAGTLLSVYPRLPAGTAVALVRAALQYQSALWVADDDPGLAWLQLVGALEAASTSLRGPAGPYLERVRRVWPELAEILDEAPSAVAARAAKTLAPTVRAQLRVLTFVEKFGPPPPEARPTHGKLNWSELTEHVRTIYSRRSDALHKGLPIPVPMLQSPWFDADGVAAEIGLGGGYGSGDASWAAKDVPMLLHTWVYIVGETLRRWWGSAGSVGSDAGADGAAASPFNA